MHGAYKKTMLIYLLKLLIRLYKKLHNCVKLYIIARNFLKKFNNALNTLLATHYNHQSLTKIPSLLPTLPQEKHEKKTKSVLPLGSPITINP